MQSYIFALQRIIIQANLRELIRTIEHSLRCALGGRYDQQSWEDLLPFVEHCLNTSPNATICFTPYEPLYGIEARRTFVTLAPPTGDTSTFVAERVIL